MHKLTTVVSLIAGLALQSVANAGLHVNVPVSVSTSSSVVFVEGSVMGAMTSNDANQSIGCEANISSGTSSIACGAANAAGNIFTCTIDNPPIAMMQAVNAINSTSSIDFQYDVSSRLCTLIKVYNSSQFY